ncbi:hypothetical protein Pan216_46070 [Planctomycetes bacterium Pan216]|uniref:DUF4350 domain-containing protein n=1 Tax=Kolteria novifilia TaxID=2527975 RepID=A0A518B9R1_9BACT|nr:hypothetical protein Pan216_46070 [Planctomycetes bacterium Pan216]
MTERLSQGSMPERSLPHPCRQSFRRWARTLLCVAVVLASVSPAQAQGKADVEDIRVGFQGFVKLGFWVPIAVDVQAKDDPIRAIRLSTPDSDDMQTTIGRESFVPANSRDTIHHFIKLGDPTSAIVVGLYGDEGAPLEGRSFGLVDATDIKLLDFEQSLHVGFGRPTGLLEAAGGPHEIGQPAKPDNVVLIQSPAELPSQWFAYGAVDTVVLPTGNADALRRIPPLRTEALLSWVRQGGHLVVSCGDNWQEVSKGFLAPLLPGTLTGTSRLRVPDSLEIYADVQTRFDAGTQGLTIADLKDVTGQVVLQKDGRPLIVSGAYGFGEVTFLTFDTDVGPFTQWTGRQAFWKKLLGLKKSEEVDLDNFGVGRVGYSGVSDLSTLLFGKLEDFPAVKLVPFGLVAGLIFGYILLIGPVDYFVLKRMGRLELTWITFPTLVVVISVAAYFIAHWIKGDALRINQIQIVDVDAESGTLRGSSFMALFSPRIDTYSLTTTPALGTNGTWEDLGMGASQSDRLVSWLGSPEDAVRGLSRGGVGLLGRQGYDYEGPDAKGLLDVPIQVWSVKTFVSRWLARAGNVLDADLHAEDVFLTGTVTNNLEVPLEDVMVAYGGQVYLLPKLQPGVAVDIAATRSRTLVGYLGKQRLGGTSDYSLAAESLRRNNVVDVVRTILFAQKTPETVRGFPNNYLSDLDLSDQLELGKIIVFGRVSSPGGTLWLNEDANEDGASASLPDNIRNDVFLRVVLEPHRDNP